MRSASSSSPRSVKRLFWNLISRRGGKERAGRKQKMQAFCQTMFRLGRKVGKENYYLELKDICTGINQLYISSLWFISIVLTINIYCILIWSQQPEKHGIGSCFVTQNIVKERQNREERIILLLFQQLSHVCFLCREHNGKVSFRYARTLFLPPSHGRLPKRGSKPF